MYAIVIEVFINQQLIAGELIIPVAQVDLITDSRCEVVEYSVVKLVIVTIERAARKSFVH